MRNHGASKAQWRRSRPNFAILQPHWPWLKFSSTAKSRMDLQCVLLAISLSNWQLLNPFKRGSAAMVCDSREDRHCVLCARLLQDDSPEPFTGRNIGQQCRDRCPYFITGIPPLTSSADSLMLWDCIKLCKTQPLTTALKVLVRSLAHPDRKSYPTLLGCREQAKND